MTVPGQSIILREGHIFPAAALLIGPIAVFSSKAMMPLLILVVVFLLGLAVRRRTEFPRVSKYLLVGFLLLLAWNLLGTVWSVDPSRSLKLVGSLFAIFALGLLFMASANRIGTPDQRRTGGALLAGVALAMFFFAFEALSDNWLTRTGRGLDWQTIINHHTGGINIDAYLKNGVVILTLLFWPAATILARRKAWLGIGALSVGLGLIIFRYDSLASLGALLMGSVLSLIAWWSRKWASRLLAVGFVLTLLSAPFWPWLFLSQADLGTFSVQASKAGFPNSALNRLFVWKFTGAKILERPFLGWGLDSSRSIPGGNEKFIVREDMPNTTGKRELFRDFYLPLHPHNQPLQIWLELGGVGALILAIMGGGIFWNMGRSKATDRWGVFSFGLAVSILTFDYLSFGAWQSWWIATQFLSVGLMMLVGISSQPNGHARRLN